VSVHVASASWVAPRSAPTLAPSRAAVSALAKEEPKASRSKEFLDEAKNEEEIAFLAMAAEKAATARSAEAIAAQRAIADAAVAALKDRPEVAAALEKTAKPTGKLAKAMRKPSGSMALVGEGKALGITDVSLLGGYDLFDPAYLSEELRKGGCSAMCVTVDMDDALSSDALAKTVAEQATAKGNFPGPLPTFCRAPVVDPLQIAAAALDGAVGVILPLSLNDKAKTAELMATCESVGLESMVRVCDAEQMADAVELGAGIIVVGDCALDEATALIADLPKGKNGVVTVADLLYNEVRGAWQCRDAGFNALMSGTSMLEVCVRDRVPPTAVSKAILSKGSVKYGLGMQKGRLEGSKEQLGSLAA